MMALDENCCQLCGANNYEIVYKQNFEIDAKYEDIFWSHYHSQKKKYHYNVVKCKKCYHFFSNPVLNKKYLDKIYSDSIYDNNWNENKNTLKKNYQSYYNLMASYIQDNDKVLEIGSDTGILSEIILRNKKIQLTCMEPNKIAFNSSKNFLRDFENVKFLNSFYNSDTKINEQYDNIVLIHVLDHIYDTKSFINQLKKNLKKSGKVHIVVHDIKSRLSMLLKSKFPPINIQHINFFSRKSLTEFMKNHGFKILDINSTINTYSLRHYVESSPLNNNYIINILKFLKIDKFPLSMKLGNFMLTAEIIN